MSSRQEVSQPELRLKIMLVEDDPMFRLGLLACLNQYADLQIVWEAKSSAVALRVLQNILASRTAGEAALPTPDLIILSLNLEQSQGGLFLCQQLRSQFPLQPLLLLGAGIAPEILAQAYQSGAAGFCAKGTDCADLVQTIRRVAAGQSDWQQGLQLMSRALSRSASVMPATASQEWSTWAVLRNNLRCSGIEQIDAAIAQINAQLQYPHLTVLDQLVLTGRRRELRAARWLVNRLLATAPPVRVNLPPRSAPPAPPTDLLPPLLPTTASNPPGSVAEAALLPQTVPPTGEMLAPLPNESSRLLQVSLFDATASQLQAGFINLTETPLEIDILKDEKKRELFYIILRKLEDLLAELRFSQVQPEQLRDKSPTILQDLWQEATLDFVGRYYTLPGAEQPVELASLLLQDREIVQAAILDEIPLVPEFFCHLLFQTPLTIDDRTFAAGTVDAMQRMGMILQHLLIQVANAVMQPLLNRYGNVPEIKQTFYDKRLLSSREIERFRNNLSWRYRVEAWVGKPTAIFESRYNLLVFQDGGIRHTSIYAPRTEELEQLTGLPLMVTLVLEARDAVSPRLRSAVSFVGSGVVYLLTEVIGRSIGLIGRGIVKGIGNVLQEPKVNRKDERLR